MARSHAPFDAFVAASADGLLRTAYLLTWDEREAEDLVQECLFKLVRVWGRVSAMEQPLAYARRMLVNLALDDAQRRGRRRAELNGAMSLDEDLPYGKAATEALDPIDFEERDELMTALGELAPRQRAVLVLRYFLDLSEAETARALGCSVGTVKSTASKALANVRRQLELTSQPEVTEP